MFEVSLLGETWSEAWPFGAEDGFDSDIVVFAKARFISQQFGHASKCRNLTLTVAELVQYPAQTRKGVK